ncbi:MAG: cyclic nucleotide-binding domain-containing protein [Romboutsia sp.]|uniref:cyclic nucleotide-binding domain-containing protein n=1 Tax=Romboutsia sp. TaxID=1965302 RepID=UPI003F3A6089
MNDLNKIEDLYAIKDYYNKFNMNNIFEKDMTGHIKLLKFEKSEYLCREGDILEYFLFLIEGKAKAFKTLPNGRALLFSFYKPSQVIGDLEIAKNQVATGTLEALSTCYCLGINMEYARTELTNDNKFLNFICKSLANKLEGISINSSKNLLYPLESRLASYINELRLLKDNECIDEYIDFQENLNNVAELLGSSYRHLLRTFNTLCKKGVLEKDDKGYKIVNVDLLEEMAEDLYQNVNFI